MDTPVIEEGVPTGAEYRALRAAAGWPPMAAEVAVRGLAGSWFAVRARHDGTAVGCGRLIGDGALYFYVQDVLVLPAWRGRGVGARIMQALLAHLDAAAPPGTFVGLMAAEGQAGFHARFGFVRRAPGAPGMFRRVPAR